MDTPGLREVGTWGIDPEALGACFPEFRPFLDGCRFDNCRHLAEPGCAVRNAADDGAFDLDRLVSYQRIYEEVTRSFLVQRSASRALIFAIMAAKASSRLNLLRVGQADHDEQDVGELHRQRPFRLILLLGLFAEPVVDLAGQLTDLFREAREVGERGEVSLLILPIH